VNYIVYKFLKIFTIIYFINFKLFFQSGSGKKYTLGIDIKKELEKGLSEDTGNLISL